MPTFKNAVKPSDFNLRGGLCGSNFRKSEKETVACNIIWDAKKKGDRWNDFTFAQYCELRTRGTANADEGVLEEFVTEDEVLDKKDDAYSVNENFFRVLAQFIKTT
ncbi:MAG: hypothetical protein Q7R93_01770 [bacterium]|nr:hypothetical protein [bacterium]